MLPVVGPLMLQLQSNLLRQTFIFLSLSRLRTISRTSHIISSRGATTGKGRGHGPAMLNNPYKKGITKMAQQRESGFLSFFFSVLRDLEVSGSWFLLASSLWMSPNTTGNSGNAYSCPCLCRQGDLADLPMQSATPGNAQLLSSLTIKKAFVLHKGQRKNKEI